MLLCTFQTGNNPKMWQSGILPFDEIGNVAPPKGISSRRATTPKAMAFEAELDLAKLLFYSKSQCLESAELIFDIHKCEPQNQLIMYEDILKLKMPNHFPTEG